MSFHRHGIVRIGGTRFRPSVRPRKGARVRLRTLRTPTRRWEKLTALLAKLHTCFAAAARLDAHHRHSDRRDDGLRFEHRLDFLQAQIDQEVSRLTVEGLIADLARKRRKALARQDAA